jgi:hypothetical protein
MKVIDLLESDPLADLERIMKLRATASKVSQENAEKAIKLLASRGYRWSFEQVGDVSFIHISMASFAKDWRNMPGKTERAKIRTELKHLGYVTAPFRGNAIKQEANPYGGPHVYFW